MRNLFLFLLSASMTVTTVASAQKWQMPNASPTCDPRNPNHVPIDQVRTNITKAANADDNGQMYCWAYIGAMYGDSTSEAGYGELLAKGGFGVSVDLSAALYFRKDAAEHGNTLAAEFLAFQYLHGDGTPADRSKAQRWYDVAMKDPAVAADVYPRIEGHNFPLVDHWKNTRQTLPPAYGGCIPDHTEKVSDKDAYAASIDQRRSEPERLCWLYVSAMRGNASSEADWANMLLNGTGVPESQREAFIWSKKSAEQGNAFGAYNVATAYENGYGTPVDQQKARRWMIKALQNPEVRRALTEKRDRQEGIDLANGIINAMDTHDACEEKRTSYQRAHGIDPCGSGLF